MSNNHIYGSIMTKLGGNKKIGINIRVYMNFVIEQNKKNTGNSYLVSQNSLILN